MAVIIPARSTRMRRWFHPVALRRPRRPNSNAIERLAARRSLRSGARESAPLRRLRLAATQFGSPSNSSGHVPRRRVNAAENPRCKTAHWRGAWGNGGRAMLTQCGKLGLLGWIATMGLGCAHARVVERHEDGSGVVAIPDNTNSWPSRNHRRAEQLIAQQCPTGYIIEREQEVSVGPIADTHTNTSTHSVPVLTPLGLAPSTADTQQTTSYQDVKEWRIWYRPKGVSPASNVAPAGGVFPASAIGPPPR